VDLVLVGTDPILPKLRLNHPSVSVSTAWW
jgi:hypothetical protein